MNKKDPTYDNYPFWDAYKEVKNGNWTEGEFLIWCQTVWNDGADTHVEMENNGLWSN